MYFPTSSALIEFLILAVLEQGDSYGYEISQTIKLIANIKESTLYPILKKLEGNSFLTTYSNVCVEKLYIKILHIRKGGFPCTFQHPLP
ncbi:transcriptional regulator [Streptococcus pneumoniae]|nr:transcriptional regulator [Streptococcus pneumoniae]